MVSWIFGSIGSIGSIDPDFLIGVFKDESFRIDPIDPKIHDTDKQKLFYLQSLLDRQDLIQY